MPLLGQGLANTPGEPGLQSRARRRRGTGPAGPSPLTAGRASESPRVRRRSDSGAAAEVAGHGERRAWQPGAACQGEPGGRAVVSESQQRGSLPGSGGEAAGAAGRAGEGRPGGGGCGGQGKSGYLRRPLLQGWPGSGSRGFVVSRSDGRPGAEDTGRTGRERGGMAEGARGAA